MGNQAYKRKHKAQGLCVNCSRPVIKDSTCCLTCRLSHQKGMRNHYANNRKQEIERSRRKVKQRKQNNKCIACSAPLDPDPDSDYITCINCRESIQRIR